MVNNHSGTIAGFTDATSGQVYFDGQVINTLPANQRQVNTVFKILSTHECRENVVSASKHNVPKDEIETRLSTRDIQLADLGERNQEISGGQQRVAIAWHCYAAQGPY